MTREAPSVRRADRQREVAAGGPFRLADGDTVETGEWSSVASPIWAPRSRAGRRQGGGADDGDAAARRTELQLAVPARQRPTGLEERAA